MKTPITFIGAFAVCCIVALVIGTASGAAMTQQGFGNNLKDKAGQFGPQKLIERPEQQGVDVTGIKTAMQNSDTPAVKEWLQSYRQPHPAIFPTRGDGPGPGSMNGDAKGDRIVLMLDNLAAQGYDVSAIRTAVTNGNYETAHTLMQEFRTAHPDVVLAPRPGACSGHLGRQRGAQKYPVT